MDYKITGHNPEKFFHFFEEISAIPRGSKNEKAISNYLVEFAKARNLWFHQDDLYNVIIKKEGSKGAENLPPVMLQGHIDMVCEKLADVEHDFTQDGLDLIIKDGMLTANGTTLGADNGVAIAFMLMILEDESIQHPPLECVFTTQEEIGLCGAAALDKSLISARTMINMDSEEEGIATVSCAGGLRVLFSRQVKREETEGSLMHLSISGLLGGHSGSDAHKERQNGNLLLARIIYHLLKNTDAQLVNFSGGTKDNAIPRESDATLVYGNKDAAVKAKKIAQEFLTKLTEELIASEPNFRCTITTEDSQKVSALSKEDANALINAMYLAPNGVQKRNVKMDGFVVVSSNLGIVSTEESRICMVFSPRSSVASLMEDFKERLSLLADTFGFEIEYSGEYPGWSFVEESPIRKVFLESYRSIFGKELKIEAIHAGLECGLFSDALPGLDAIAVGPTIHNCHTPDEYLPLDSLERFYTLLKEVLKRLAER